MRLDSRDWKPLKPVILQQNTAGKTVEKTTVMNLTIIPATTVTSRNSDVRLRRFAYAGLVPDHNQRIDMTVMQP
jgi:hypothetical protein